MIQIQPGGVEGQGGEGQNVPINQEASQNPQPEMPNGVSGVPEPQGEAPAPQGLDVTNPTETAAPQPGGIPGGISEPGQEVVSNTIDASQPPSKAGPELKPAPDSSAPMPGGDLTGESKPVDVGNPLPEPKPVATPAPQPETNQPDPSENSEQPPAEPPEIGADTDESSDARGAVKAGNHDALEKILEGNATTSGNSQDASSAELTHEAPQNAQDPQPNQKPSTTEPVTPADKALDAMREGEKDESSTSQESIPKDSLGSNMTSEQHRNLIPENPETPEDRIVDRINELRKERDELIRQRDTAEDQVRDVDARIEELLGQYAQERRRTKNNIEQGGGEK